MPELYFLIHIYMISHFKTTTWISRQRSRQFKNNLYKNCWVCRVTSVIFNSTLNLTFKVIWRSEQMF